MRHNAHYKTEFDGIKIPVAVSLVEVRNDETIKVFSKGDEFGDVICELYRNLKTRAVAVDVCSSRMTIFGFTPVRRDFIRLSFSVRDFISAVFEANEGEE